MELGKLNQSRIALNALKKCKCKCSELAGNLVKKLPDTSNKFNNNPKKQYYTNAEKNHPKITWRLLKRIYLAWTSLKFPIRTEYRRNL